MKDKPLKLLFHNAILPQHKSIITVVVAHQIVPQHLSYKVGYLAPPTSVSVSWTLAHQAPDFLAHPHGPLHWPVGVDNGYI